MLPEDELIPLPAAADIACSLVNGAWREQFDGDLRLVALALSRVAGLYAGGRRLSAAEAAERLSRPHAPLDGLWIRRRDLNASVTTLKATVLLSAVRIHQSRAAIARSRKMLSG